MNIKTKIVGAAGTGIILLSLASQAAFAAPRVRIHHNGAGSTNHAAVIKVSKSKVKQKNITVVGTGVVNVSNTGDNHTNNNTGGNNNIDTGDTTTTTRINVDGGTNTNVGENCCCDGEENGETVINIHHNGAGSDNSAFVLDICKHKVKQTNVTVVETEVTNVSNTGGNTSSGNVGGTNDIDTGNTTTTTTVTVTGSTNTN